MPMIFYLLERLCGSLSPHLRLPQYSYPHDLYLPPGGSPIVKNNALPCLPQAHWYSRATFEQNLKFEDVTPKVFLFEMWYCKTWPSAPLPIFVPKNKTEMIKTSSNEPIDFFDILWKKTEIVKSLKWELALLPHSFHHKNFTSMMIDISWRKI